ncbi:YveK family protein [Paenibacillus kobensis]|uniref:YveK family protein n=1 Tax=Paenibacillus kobensis TaxID=59841 RepID=UPI0013E3D91E|nr:Wzz/FepE/Etk N-terminal domain-containing protein [Paenibacillus kobensis]
MPDEIDLLDYITIVRRRLWLIVLLVIIGSGAAYGYGQYKQEPVFEASAKLIMTRTAAGGGTDAPDSKVIEANLMLIETYKEIIRTPVVLKRVASEHPELGMSSGEIAGKIRVSSSSTSQVLTIQARDGSYSRAAKLVNAVSSVFLAEAERIYKTRNIEQLYTAEDSPAAAPAPLNMGMKKLLVFAVVLSAIAGVGLAVLLEFLDRTVKSERDIARVLGLPTLVELALLRVNETPGARSRKLRMTGESRDVPIEK